MKNLKSRIATFLVLMMTLSALIGCGGSGNSQVNYDTLEAGWADYTIGVDLITDDPELASNTDTEYTGKPLKICFRHINNPNGDSGFDSETIFDDLAAHPITLKHSDGTVYEFTGGVGHFRIQINASGQMGMADYQPRFSITFDVPAEAFIEDFVVIIDGQEYKLLTYASAAYTEEFLTED